MDDRTRDFVKKAKLAGDALLAAAQESRGDLALGIILSRPGEAGRLARKYADLAGVAAELLAELDVMIERHCAAVDTIERLQAELAAANDKLTTVRAVVAAPSL